MSALLEVTGLRGGYGRVEVLRGVDLSVSAGEVVALLGSNGAGKTTLNNAVCAIVPAWSGRVRFEGRDLTRAHYREVVEAGLIQVPEGRKIFPNLDVRENLMLGAYRRGRARRAANLDRVLAIFPRLLILDEPSLGLSPLLVEELFALIRRLHDDGLAVLLVEQNVGQSLEIADRAYVLENGAIRFAGRPAELLASDTLRRAYLGL